jgi:hypothetical protein
MYSAPSRLRDREASIRAALIPGQATVLHDWLRLQSKALLLTGNRMWTLLFFVGLGVFTPLHGNQFSHLLISIFDMATLALLAASPIILGKSTRPLVLNAPTEML